MKDRKQKNRDIRRIERGAEEEKKIKWNKESKKN